jgi:hypothetical protein
MRKPGCRCSWRELERRTLRASYAGVDHLISSWNCSLVLNQAGQRLL